MSRFFEKVDNAATASGNQGYVTIDTLKQELTTPAWKDLEDPESTLCKLLSTEMFKDAKKGQMGD